MTVLRSVIHPAFTAGGVQLNDSNANWGGGYEYWNGSTYSNPTYPYWYIEGDFTIPSVSSVDTNLDIYSIWSGLTSTYDGSNYIAQTGESGYGESGISSYYSLFWEFYPTYPTYAYVCSFSVYAGNSVLSATYSDAWSTSGGSTSSYNVDTYDSTLGKGCSYSNYDWSSGMGSSSKFAVLTGEMQSSDSELEDFGSTTITGTIYDNVYNGGPSGHCTSTPYNDGYTNSFVINPSDTLNGASATESLDNGHCQFTDNFDP